VRQATQTIFTLLQMTHRIIDISLCTPLTFATKQQYLM